MEANLKKIRVLITSIQKIENTYQAELSFSDGNSKTLKILEKEVIPFDIDKIIQENLVCEVEVLKRTFEDENKKGQKYKNSLIITKIEKI